MATSFIDPRHARAELLGEAQETYDDLIDADAEGPYADSDGRLDDEALKIDEHTDAGDDSTSDESDGGTAGSDEATEGEAKAGAKIIAHNADLKDKSSQNGSTSQQSVTNKTGEQTGSQQAGSQEGSSLFDKTLNKPNAGGNTSGNASGEKQPVRLSDDDLVEFNGQIVPFHTLKGSVMLKREYDSELKKLEEEKAKVAKDKTAIDVAAPYVDAMIKDPFGRSYMEGLVGTGDPEKALAMAAIASGRKVVQPEAQQERVDPRLVPPTDTAGQPLEEDDPRYLKWLAEVAPIKAEIAAEKRWNDLDAKRQAEVNAKRAEEERAQNEADAKRRESEQFTSEVQNKNIAVLNTLPQVLLSKGIDPDKLTQEQWRGVKTEFANAAERYGKLVKSDDWLAQNLLDKGDIALIVDAAGIVGKYSGGGNTNVGASKKDAPERVAEVEQGSEGSRSEGSQGKPSPKEGKLRQMHNQRRPLNAGGPSHQIAGHEGRERRMGPDDGWTGAHDELRGSSSN